jgi:thiamine biosynthesis protein ThiS
LFNGFLEEFPALELTVQDLLDRTEEDDPAVIIEINGRFIYRQDYKTRKINDGDRVEFIHPSFGG